MKTIQFTVLPPPAALSRDIECLRIASHSGNQPLEVKVCPSGYPGIVYQIAEDRTAAIENIAIRSAQTSDIPVLFLHGQGSEPSVMRFRGTPYITIQLVFKPHALYSLFGWDASVHNQGILFPDQFGAMELEKQLLASTSNEERIALLIHFLMEKKEHNAKRDELIELTLAFIHEHIASVSVKELVAAFSISERQFQKRFTRVVGMPPHLFIRVRRVNEALRMMHSGEYERLSDVAYALNYYDQSHFIRDMKSFSWISPKHITMKVSEFHSDLAGSSYL
ncbi:helix-turn-helix domain-containing protein [Paenibacillus mendelii]|uniref:Helix-turn-helix domain-containing protein n=1 Tax=Paenibacillus mendelii TaxID=206163 RepID=A0ABV6J2A3_9BACL|nr:AraC family transcriptional regulator [Paenibacillus mendelii]MCQ6560505.1 AraC family transcriptional regulator [Paenibacillus mendelii]